MKLRAPSIPIITIDPYTSIWSATDKLTDSDTVHWTGHDMPLRGVVNVDGIDYSFMGKNENMKLAKQLSLDITAMSTKYCFKINEIEFTAIFTSPMFLDDYAMLSRPLNYLEVSYIAKDFKKHSVFVTISVSEEICQDKRRQADIITNEYIKEDISIISMRSEQQPILLKYGDDVRIDWGSFYLSCKNGQSSFGRILDRSANTMYVSMKCELTNNREIFSFAYDDVKSINYFNKQLTSYWNYNGESIIDIILIAHRDYNIIKDKADSFSQDLNLKAVESGGEEYSEILQLAYRQVLAAHKLVVDTDGTVLYISKECFSNGCAATVDVSYPSVPLFLLYNPDLILGMLRPIYKYARMPEWPHAFAPHDVGTYPILCGQTYGGTIEDVQMPIEECGNMILMTVAACRAKKDYSYAKENLDLLFKWADYLIKYGSDPENQLCTDDFAGHSAHNCNLSVKAIMGIEAMSILLNSLGEKNNYHQIAIDMANSWIERARNNDNSFKLAFDKSGTFSLKYNMIWEKLFDTNVFGKEIIHIESESYLERINPYGIPLDSRADYTKSDWLVWSAALLENKKDFEKIIHSLWNSYNFSKSRVPLTDYYDTITAEQCAFQHRTVQGGLFIKMLLD